MEDIQTYLQKFDYHLPTELIAQEPVTPRDSSKLLVIDRNTKEISHHHFYELADILNENYVLVFNDTKVYPARLLGKKEQGTPVEVLLTHQHADGSWEALCSPGVKPGSHIFFDNFSLEVMRLEDRAIIVKPSVGPADFFAYIEKSGHVPVPPYIHSNLSQKDLKEKYQTVYAKENGSAAAPTAGLHFTSELLEKLKKNGIDTVTITLHVGLGTFSPVDQKHLDKKKLHTESLEITASEAEKINKAKKQGKKIIAVGTTALRALESAADEKGIIHPLSGETDIFIYPGYTFRVVNSLITNFHVPKSSLLMLVSAFCSYPNTKSRFTDFAHSLVGEAYQKAVEQHYRFYSFGDGSLIF